MRMKSLVLRCFICLFVLLTLPVAEASVFELYTGTVEGSNHDLKVSKDDGVYFLHKEDLLPGDVIKGSYTITNTSSKSYYLSLKSIIDSDSPTSSKRYYLVSKDDSLISNNVINDEKVADEWIKDINLKLTLDGVEVYNGPADGSAKVDSNYAEKEEGLFTDGIYIGEIAKNTKKVLKAEFTIPSELGNDYQEAWARVDWLFSAKWKKGSNKTPDPKPDPDPDPNPDPDPDPTPNPKPDPEPNPDSDPTPEQPPLPAAMEEEPFETPNTGDSVVSMILYGVVILGALAGIMLTLLSKKKES